MAQISSNFANLQSEYDKAQDVIESQKKDVSDLTKDLKSSIDNLNELKLKSAGLQDDLIEVQNKCQKYEKEIEDLSVLNAKSKEDLKHHQQIKAENVALKTDLETTKSQLVNLTKKHKKQDLLDLELEEAETRITSLTRYTGHFSKSIPGCEFNYITFFCCSECQTSQTEIEQLKLKLESEMNMRQNRDLQLNELEQTLARESQRATDLKVYALNIR